jgi:hypothetical protein
MFSTTATIGFASTLIISSSEPTWRTHKTEQEKAEPEMAAHLGRIVHKGISTAKKTPIDNQKLDGVHASHVGVS